jgi:hypothetical protein
MLSVTLCIGAVSFGESFTQPDNLIRTIAAGSAFLALVAVGHDLRHHQRRHRPVGRLGAGDVGGADGLLQHGVRPVSRR